MSKFPAYVRASKFVILLSGDSSSKSLTNAEPINPAPPVTKISPMILVKLSKPKVTKKANVTHVNEKAPVVKGERKQVQGMREPDSALVDQLRD